MAVVCLLSLLAAPAMAKSDKAAQNSEAAVTEEGDTNDAHANCPESAPDATQHPSGKDRYCESGGSGNQGDAQGSPDDTSGPMRAEGVAGESDQPGGDEVQGGEYLWDQDGNNGCGNDQDFDDDNNGWCGKPADVQESPPEVNSTSTPAKVEATVLGVQLERPADVAPAAEVAPAAVPATVEAAALARTGSSTLVPLVWLGTMLVAFGTVLRRRFS